MKFVSSPILSELDFITHAFLTRVGAGSEGAVAILDFMVKGWSDKSDVGRKKATMGKLFGLDPKRLVITKQVHSDNVLVIDSDNQMDKDHLADLSNTRADAIITNQQGVTIAVLTADCLPIIIVDPIKSSIGIVHTGWKGTIKGILKKTVQEFEKCFSANPEDLLISMGPSICQCCYEVDKDVAEKYKEKMDTSNIITQEDDKLRLDLKRANVAHLTECGVSEGNIFLSTLCTSCNTDFFFSYRKEGKDTGRQLSFVLIN
jgi:purine-nucleoside/S-methyl-5'-thioadenosine phosphorylase / adenosine deaminase